MIKFNDKWAEEFVKKEQENLFNKDHICPVLRMLILRCFVCELMYGVDLTEAKNILLEDIIYVNQNIIRIIRENRNDGRPVFPEYFESIKTEDQQKCMQESLQLEGLNFNEYDIRPYYLKLINVLKKSDLPRNRIFDMMIDNCEYGLYIGCLMNLEVDKSKNKVPNENQKRKLDGIRNKFKNGMDVRLEKLKEYYK